MSPDPPPLHPLLGSVRTAALILAGWGAYAALVHLQRSMQSRAWTASPEEVYVEAVRVLLLALTTPFLLYAARRLPVRAPHAARTLLLLAVITFVISAVPAVVWSFFVAPMTPWRYLSRLAVTAYDDLFLNSFLVIGTQYSILCRENAQRLHAEAGLAAAIAQARLRQLRADLNPHLLFNTLNSIAALLNDRPKEAKNVLRVLCELLQRSNEWWLQREIPLSEEVGFVARYLEIQQVRFRDRLSVTIEVPESLAGALVPPLLLQPLVENAVLHGIAPFPWPGTIRIEARRDGDALQIAIRDSGRGLNRHPQTEPGLGLANVRGRLRWMYGARQHLKLEKEPNGFSARVMLPWRTERAG